MISLVATRLSALNRAENLVLSTIFIATFSPVLHTRTSTQSICVWRQSTPQLFLACQSMFASVDLANLTET